MAATAIMETFINETTQGKQKDFMERNRTNLKKNLQHTEPPTRVLPTPRETAPEEPTFSGSNRAGFELICQHIKEYHEFTITKVDQRNEDHKNELLREVSLMATGNTNLIVSVLDFCRELKTNFVSAIESASENRTAEEGDFKKVMEEMRKQGSMIEQGLKNLVPGNETPGGINHAEIIKAIVKVHQTNEDTVQTFIREQTSTINKTIKDAQMKQTGTGNATETRQSYGPPRTNLPGSVWNNGPPPSGQRSGPGSGSGPPPAPFTSTQTPSTQTPASTAAPSTSGNGNTQNRYQEPEFITVSRPRAAVDDHGKEYADWVDTIAKKRNKDFKFTREAEDAFKHEDNKEAAILRARRQIMIYGLDDPPKGDKKTEIGNIRKVADEFGKKWLLEKGFNIQRSDLTNCITQRLWNYGGKDYKDPKPLKVTFNSPEVANKFMKAAHAAGCDGHRTKIKLGKFQNVSVDDPDWPTYFLRPGTTFEERQKIKEKREERNAHKAGPEYARYKGAKVRTAENTHRVEEADLDEITFLEPDDAGENEGGGAAGGGTPSGSGSLPGAAAGSKEGLGPSDGDDNEKVEKSVEHDPETEMEANKEDVDTVVNKEDQTPNPNQTPTSQSDDAKTNKDEAEASRKRKQEEMSPKNSLEQQKLAKKASNGASTPEV